MYGYIISYEVWDTELGLKTYVDGTVFKSEAEAKKRIKILKKDDNDWRHIVTSQIHKVNVLL